jgi:uncharacterized membrane protein
MSQQNRVWLKACAILVVVFILGIVTGGALSGLYQLQAKPTSSAAPHPRMEATDYLDTLKQDLNLSPEQVTTMQSILQETRSQYKALCAEVRPKYEGLREQSRAKMRQVLSLEQQKLFDTVVTKEDCNCPYVKK